MLRMKKRYLLDQEKARSLEKVKKKAEKMIAEVVEKALVEKNKKKHHQRTRLQHLVLVDEMHKYTHSFLRSFK